MLPIKLVDSQSGEFNFRTSDQILEYKLVIEGSPSSNIKVYFNDKHKDFNGFFLKVYCNNWANSRVILKCKVNLEDDIFTETGDVFIENRLYRFKYN